MSDAFATDSISIAADFAHAIAAGDHGALRRLLASDVQLCALTPSRAWEMHSADEAIETMLGTWFGGERHIDSVESVEADTVADIVQVRYRFLATTPAGAAVVEQQAYLTVADDVITSARVVCSGFRAVVG